MASGTVRGVFLRGLFAALPVVATIYLIVWIVAGLESMLGSVLRYGLPEGVYVPGMGLAVGVAGIFLLGLLMQAWLAQKLWAIGERIVQRMPLVRPIYGATKEIVGYVTGAERPPGQAVVAVKIGEPPVRMLGLVTRTDVPFLGERTGDDELVAVFLAWSYQVGGFTVFVPRSALEPVDLTPQEAFRLSFTAGVTTRTGSQSG